MGIRPATLKSESKILRLLAGKDVLQYLATASFSGGRKRNMASCWAAFCKYHNIHFERPRYRAEAKLPFIPLEQELEAFISSARRIHHAATLLLAKETGGRIGEITNLHFQDFDFVKKTVRITPEKGSLPRELKISDRLVAILQRMFAQGLRFPSVQAMEEFMSVHRPVLAKTQQNPRFFQIHLHSFRHWKGTMEYHRTKDIVHVKQVLGHKYLENTMKYVQLVPFEPEDQYTVRVAKNVEEATSLLEVGFEYVQQLGDTVLYRKRK